jgi:hypothetical protein
MNEDLQINYGSYLLIIIKDSYNYFNYILYPNMLFSYNKISLMYNFFFKLKVSSATHNVRVLC